MIEMLLEHVPVPTVSEGDTIAVGCEAKSEYTATCYDVFMSKFEGIFRNHTSWSWYRRPCNSMATLMKGVQVAAGTAIVL